MDGGIRHPLPAICICTKQRVSNPRAHSCTRRAWSLRNPSEDIPACNGMGSEQDEQTSILKSPSFHTTGKKGEEEALHYLQKKGYEILEQNYRWGRGEIDIICRKKNRIIFVEVKTRLSFRYGDPVEAVDRRKQKQIIRIAERYLVEKRLYGKADCRFDVITLAREALTHIEDAFRPG